MIRNSRKFVSLSDLRRTGRTSLESALTSEPDNALSSSDNKDLRAVRGILAPKDYSSENEILFFQFNPEKITDNKGFNWFNESYLGFSAPEPFWISGQDRVINFELFMDATPEALSKTFGGTSTGYENLVNYKRVYPRGVLDTVETLQVFQYPISNVKPRFLGNVAVPENRFASPPILIFSFGLFYMECYLSALNISYELFDKDLIPRRAICNVSLTVSELERVEIRNDLPKVRTVL